MASENHEHHHEAHKEHHEEHHHEHKKCFLGKDRIWKIATIVFAIAFILFFVLFLTADRGTNNSNSTGTDASCSITPDANLIGEQTVDFLSANFPVTGIVLKNAVLERGLVNVTISVQGQDLNIFTSTDGEILFIPGGAPIYKTEYAAEKAAAEAEAAKPADVPKTTKPKVDVFVMSHCPYGTQVEKGLLPVVNLLKDKADIQIKFVNYAMHGTTEITEEINQYCIQQEYSDKYYSYLGCFLEDGNTSRCIAKEGFDTTLLEACYTQTDTDFNISGMYADKATWKGDFPTFAIYDAENQLYGVQGSPSTVINGVLVKNMPRDSQGILDNICAAFTDSDKPSECNTELSTTTPGPGFGFDSTSTNTDASCS